MAELTVQVVRGGDIGDWIAVLAKLRIRVFRDFPYLYDGSEAYERRYLQTYLDSPDSIAVLACVDGQVVGAATGLPLAHETREFQRPFLQQGPDPTGLFYCGESVLLPEYRGLGFYRQFFHEREAQARRLGLTGCTFCAVQRPTAHPLRPAAYQPLDPVWDRFGYRRQPQLQTTYHWKDIDEHDESDKPMVFWLKAL